MLRHVARQLIPPAASRLTPGGARGISGNDLSRTAFGGPRNISRINEEQHFRDQVTGNLKARKKAIEAEKAAAAEAKWAAVEAIAAAKYAAEIPRWGGCTSCASS